MNQPDWVMFGIPQDDGSVVVYMTEGLVEADVTITPSVTTFSDRMDSVVHAYPGQRAETALRAHAIGVRTWIKGVDYEQCLRNLAAFWEKQKDTTAVGDV